MISRTSKTQTVATWTCFALLLLFALGLRVWRLPDECPHWDEVASLRHLDATTLSGFIADVRMSDPPMTPVYFAIEYYWSRLTGGSVESMRALSILFTCVSFLLFFLLARILCGTTGALAGLLALTMSAGHIYYAQEIRPYALILLFTLLSATALWRAHVSGDSKWWLVNIVCNILLTWTHLFTVFFVLSQGVFLSLRSVASQCRIRTLLFWILAQLPGILLLLVWVSGIDTASLEEAASWREQIHHSYIQLLGDFLLFCGAGVPMFRDLPAPVAAWHMGSAMWRFFGCTLAVYIASSLWRSRKSPDLSTKLAFLVTWAAVPSIAQFLVSALVYSCHGSRYVISGSLPVLIMIGGVASLPRRTAFKGLLIMLIAGIYAVNLNAHPKPWRPDAAAVVDRLAGLSNKHRMPVIVFRGADVAVLEFMNAGAHPLPPFGYASSTEEISGALGTPTKEGQERCLVLFQHELPDTFVRDVEVRLKAQGWSIDCDTLGYTNPVHVYRLSGQPMTGPPALHEALGNVPDARGR